jgi:hypothetical protein
MHNVLLLMLCFRLALLGAGQVACAYQDPLAVGGRFHMSTKLSFELHYSVNGALKHWRKADHRSDGTWDALPSGPLWLCSSGKGMPVAEIYLQNWLQSLWYLA